MLNFLLLIKFAVCGGGKVANSRVVPYNPSTVPRMSAQYSPPPQAQRRASISPVRSTPAIPQPFPRAPIAAASSSAAPIPPRQRQPSPISPRAPIAPIAASSSSALSEPRQRRLSPIPPLRNNFVSAPPPPNPPASIELDRQENALPQSGPRLRSQNPRTSSPNPVDQSSLIRPFSSADIAPNDASLQSAASSPRQRRPSPISPRTPVSGLPRGIQSAVITTSDNSRHHLHLLHLLHLVQLEFLVLCIEGPMLWNRERMAQIFRFQQDLAVAAIHRDHQTIHRYHTLQT